MAKKDAHQPATKGDLTAVKDDLAKVESGLKADLAKVESGLKADLAKVESGLKADIQNLSGDILKINFRMDRMEDTMNTKVAMKSDLNRIYNLLDSISGDIKSYQRQDVLRGDAVMRHETKLSDHENRITLLEPKK